MIRKLSIMVVLSTMPWGEWALAVPAGLLMELPLTLVVPVAFTSNLLPVLFICALWGRLGGRLRRWSEKRQKRARGYLQRYGIAGLIFLAPVSVGVYFSTITSLLAGISPYRTVLMHICSLGFWGLAVTGLGLLGVNIWEVFS